MSLEIVVLPRVRRSAQALAKRYKSFAEDWATLINSLREDAHQGVELTPGIRKVRMTIRAKGRGKSGGARVITYDALVVNGGGRLYIAEIYDKSDFDTIDVGVLKGILVEEGIIDLTSR